jgi:hypothetical protein
MDGREEWRNNKTSTGGVVILTQPRSLAGERAHWLGQLWGGMACWGAPLSRPVRASTTHLRHCCYTGSRQEPSSFWQRDPRRRLGIFATRVRSQGKQRTANISSSRTPSRREEGQNRRTLWMVLFISRPNRQNQIRARVGTYYVLVSLQPHPHRAHGAELSLTPPGVDRVHTYTCGTPRPVFRIFPTSRRFLVDSRNRQGRCEVGTYNNTSISFIVVVIVM